MGLLFEGETDTLWPKPRITRPVVWRELKPRRLGGHGGGLGRWRRLALRHAVVHDRGARLAVVARAHLLGEVDGTEDGDAGVADGEAPALVEAGGALGLLAQIGGRLEVVDAVGVGILTSGWGGNVEGVRAGRAGVALGGVRLG